MVSSPRLNQRLIRLPLEPIWISRGKPIEILGRFKPNILATVLLLLRLICQEGPDSFVCDLSELSQEVYTIE